jgi:F-type H+-transporting ATPase subunit gamma
MATLKEVEGRIKSTANIAKITKAMQMVAASKLRGAEERLKGARPLMAMVEEMTSLVEAPPSKKTVFVPITTDRGLCGGVNIQITKELSRVHVPAEKEAGAEVEIMCVGDKGRSQLKRFAPNELKTTIAGMFAQVLPNFGQASVAAEQALLTDADKYAIFYNKFVSAVKQEPTLLTVPSARVMQEMDVDPLNEYEIESARADLVNNFGEFTLAAGIFTGMVENQCSEIASKMAAMDNATRNCESLVEKLQIQYNKARQSIITTELIEIISGAEALNG